MRYTTTAAGAALLATVQVFAAAPATTSAVFGRPSEFPQLGSAKSQGCFSSSGNLVKLDPPIEFMSMGSCTLACIAIKANVSALHATDCFCGDEYPPRNTFTPDNTHCNYPCPYYGSESCTCFFLACCGN